MNDRIKQLLEMLEGDNDPFLKYALALEYQKSDHPEKAVVAFQSLLEENPEYLATYYQLAKLLEEAGKEEEALVIYKQGAVLAEQQRDMKTLGELNEAIWFLED